MSSIFVTVGTTKFDSLVENVLSDESLHIFCTLGYQKMVIQYGAGKDICYSHLRSQQWRRARRNQKEKQKEKGKKVNSHKEYLYVYKTRGRVKGSMKIILYRYKNDILEDMEEADLIISHAGAGSIMEGLGLQKQMVVVINESLMGNHQTEVADALEAENYLFSTTPGKLATLLLQKDLSHLKIRPSPNTSLFPALLRDELGI
jgi:beta-1,4-N-acetylglucosaminyltransferase